jgi:hypothetical protein
MSIVQLSPLRVGTLAWQPEPGAFTLTVCVKATFALVHGEPARLAAVDEAIGPATHEPGEPGASLRAPADLVPFKRRADVLLVGHAYAPGGAPTTDLVARLTFGDFSKAIGVTGDRLWTRTPTGLRPSAPAPFTRMPLRYERALRGPYNPVGLDPAALPIEGAPALPNHEATSVLEEGGMVGFGPIAPAWPGRRALVGDASPAWLERAEGPAPPGFDFGYFNAAPPDQQLDLLRASSRVVLENLSPSHPRLETTLPPLRPRVFLVAPSGRASDVALRCDTLWIDTDRAIAVLTWRGLASVAGPDPSAWGTVVVAAEARGRELRARQIERLLREGGEVTVERLDELAEPDALARRHDAVKARVAPDARPMVAAAPFDPRAEPPRSPTPARAPLEAPEAPAPGDDVEDLEETTTTGNERLAAPPSPCTEPPPALAQPGPAIPFLAPPAVASGVHAEGEARAGDEPRASDEARASEEARAGDEPGVSEQGGMDAHEASAPDADAPHGVSLERFARLSVALGAPKATRSAVLARDGLTPAAWSEIERAWTERLQSEAESGGSELAARLRAARALAHEASAGPALSVADYARIAVGVERGDVPRVLAEHKLGLADLMRLQRSWTQRAAEDPQLATALAEAMEAARWE